MFPGLKQTIAAAALLGFGGVAGWHGSRVLGDSASDELPRFAQPFARAVRRSAALVGPSVVRVEAKHASGLSPSSGFGAAPAPDAFPDETARRLFMSPFGFEGEGDQARFVTRGSGIIIDASGLVLANAHVIASRQASRRIEMPEVRVTLADGRTLPAIVLGCDAGADLALLRLPEGTSGLMAARLGDSERLEQGDWVVALGRTFRRLTASAGIVSTKGKTGLAPRFEDFIETDAAVNPANSGGPLVS
ncbi:MAG TPA: trypsin-like peptidase domain-containing protein, partial [Planctomycetota bacterium]|nr:trypsin-like peptidase domain-containing protein [Planctomycetota bacterium]